MKRLIFFLCTLCVCHILFPQAITSDFQLPGIPGSLTWMNKPFVWSYNQNKLVITAGEKTDMFVDPQQTYKVLNTPAALFQPSDTFLLSSQVHVDFESVYDAGVLMVYGDDFCWAKLCFEYSSQKKPTIVSVVNKDTSDDTNHFVINNNKIYLRIAGLGDNVFAFFYSSDGNYWHLVRYFSLDKMTELRIGFSSQSPTGEKCTSIFTDITYKTARLLNIRNGK